MTEIDFSKGLWLGRIQSHQITITTSQLSQNSSYGNMLRNPQMWVPIGRYNFPDQLWDTRGDFAGWLQETFRHLDDGVYVILAWSGSISWIKRAEKIYKKVRHFIPFAKFAVEGGSILFDKSMEKNGRGRHYWVWLHLNEENEPRSIEMLPRPKRIKL
jgi:hypothetical protein